MTVDAGRGKTGLPPAAPASLAEADNDLSILNLHRVAGDPGVPFGPPGAASPCIKSPQVPRTHEDAVLELPAPEWAALVRTSARQRVVFAAQIDDDEPLAIHIKLTSFTVADSRDWRNSDIAWRLAHRWHQGSDMHTLIREVYVRGDASPVRDMPSVWRRRHMERSPDTVPPR